MTTVINETAIPAGTWNLDASHSNVGFTVRHAGISKVRGSFQDFTAQVIVGEEENDITVNTVIKADSFTTGDAGRDGHVKSADFFEVETHPELTFNSTSLKETSKGLVLDGILTIRGVSKEVSLDVEFNGLAVDAFGLTRIGLEAETTISRKEYGMTWNAALEAGGVLVSDKVKVSLDLSFVKE